MKYASFCSKKKVFKRLKIGLLHDRMMKKDLILMGILAGLAFLISFSLSAPSLSMNDESITVNQLHQLFSGSDILMNEGKYGTMFTGETSAYYQKRNNYLAYSLFLPVLALPAMYVINFSGDSFRLFFIFIFGIVGVITILGCLYLTSGNDNNFLRIILIVSMIAFILFFFTNILLYSPFPAGKDQPIETAAVVFTNGILFSLMAPLSYGLFHPFLKDYRLTIFAVTVLLGSSSYMIWADTAKDHLAVAFLLLLLFFTYSKIIYNSSSYLWALFFLIAGLLIWARTEYGICITLVLFCWYLWLFRKTIWNNSGNLSIKQYINIIFPGLIGLGIGILPFLWNNYITTRNIFIPPQYLYVSGSNSITGIVADHLITSNTLVLMQSEGVLFLNQVINFLIPRNFQIFNAFQILFNPENGAAGILFIAPLVIPGFFYYILNYKKRYQNYSTEMREMAIFSTIIVCITIFAYLRAIPGSNINPGMFPDMRYFSPLYLPLNIIGIILISPVLVKVKMTSLKTLIGSIGFVPSMLIAFLIFILPNGIYNFIAPLEMISWSLLLICILTIVPVREKILMERYFFFLCVILICIPITFQIIVMMVFGILHFNGYGFWLPVMEKITAIIMVFIG